MENSNNSKVFLDLKRVPDIEVHNWICKSKDDGDRVCVNKQTGSVFQFGKDDIIRIRAKNHETIIDGERIDIRKKQDVFQPNINDEPKPKEEPPKRDLFP